MGFCLSGVLCERPAACQFCFFYMLGLWGWGISVFRCMYYVWGVREVLWLYAEPFLFLVNQSNKEGAILSCNILRLVWLAIYIKVWDFGRWVSKRFCVEDQLLSWLLPPFCLYEFGTPETGKKSHPRIFRWYLCKVQCPPWYIHVQDCVCQIVYICIYLHLVGVAMWLTIVIICLCRFELLKYHQVILWL